MNAPATCIVIQNKMSVIRLFTRCSTLAFINLNRLFISALIMSSSFSALNGHTQSSLSNSNSNDTAPDNKKRTFQLRGVSVIAAIPRYTGENLTVDEMRAAANQSELLQRNYSDLEQDLIFFPEFALYRGRPQLSLLLNIDINSQNKVLKKLRPELRAGLSYASSHLVSGGREKEETTPITTSDNEAVDSIHTQRLGFDNVPSS